MCIERFERAHMVAISTLRTGSGGVDSGGQVALTQLAVEEIEDQTVEAVRQLGVVAWAFIAHKGMGSIDLVPA